MDPQDLNTELVFIDLDRCLLIDDSIGAFLTRLVDRGLVPRSALLRGAVAYLSYRLNLADPAAMIHRGVQHMVGIEEAVLEEEALVFFREVARFRYRRKLLEELDQHRAAGRRMHILTGGLPYLTRHIVEDLEFDGFRATEAETEDGCFTGRVLAPPCVGDGKIVHAQRTAETDGHDLTGSWFYSDSYSDLPMLLVAENPVAVNPDGKLYRWAKRHNWRIVT